MLAHIGLRDMIEYFRQLDMSTPHDRESLIRVKNWPGTVTGLCK